MKALKASLICGVVLCSLSLHTVHSQGTGKVQEFFKKYFGEYFPKTTRSYTLYGNGLNGPADYNAGLPIPEETEGPIKSIIIRRGSPSKNSQGAQQHPQPPMPMGMRMGGPMPPMGQAPPQLPAGFENPNAWQPSSSFDPVSKGGHRGRSDITEEFDETAESRIITAEDILEAGDDGTREFRIESSMSFSPGSVHRSELDK